MGIMSTSRQDILEYIRIHGAVSAVEIARALRMTRANAHHHLKILSELGQIELVGSRSTANRGRPADLYGLSEKVIGDNLHVLASALLQITYKAGEETERAQLLQELAHTMLEAVSPDIHRGDSKDTGAASLTLRLNRAVKLLNAMKYQARWEAHADAPYLIMGHCPYARIIPEHPELCRLDALILEELLGSPARQVSKLLPNASGLRYCEFRIGLS